MQTYTFKEFNAEFSSDDACLDWLRHHLYPQKIYCRQCKRPRKFHRVKTRKVYECDYCGYQLSPTAGTIFHKSSTSLKDWFYAIFLMSNTRTGISAMHLKRELGVTYKTAWRMFTMIRSMMQNYTTSLFGQVEVDETYIGGRRHGKRGRGAEGKTIAMGMVQRNGKAVVKIVPNVKAQTLLPIIREHIPVTGKTIVFTDEHRGYDRLVKMGFRHGRVLHFAKQYVNGAAHVDNVEGLWSIIKNGILGANRHVSPQYLQGYLDSYVFRYNHRKSATPMFWLLLRRVAP